MFVSPSEQNNNEVANLRSEKSSNGSILRSRDSKRNPSPSVHHTAYSSSPDSVQAFCDSTPMNSSKSPKKVSWNNTVKCRFFPRTDQDQKDDLWWSPQDFNSFRRQENWRRIFESENSPKSDSRRCDQDYTVHIQ